jgi:hypothetical protein
MTVGRESNRQRRARQAASAREKAAANRAAAERAAQRRRAQTFVGGAVVVALLIAIGVYVGVKSSSSGGNDRTLAAPSLVSSVTGIQPAELQSVGAGSGKAVMQKTTGDPALTANGKPEVLFIGAEWCPFCAAERWALLQALSRFGTFTGLSTVHSAANDGDIATFSFYRAHYVSKYVTFTSVEAETRDKKALQTPTKAELALWQKYGGGFPFFDVGGKYYQTTSGYDYNDLSGMSQTKIAAQLQNPDSTVAKAVLGEANRITAAICTQTKNQPIAACLSPDITNLQSELDA